MGTEFFTLEMLITFAGCGLATGVFTQMFKKANLFVKIPSQVVSYIVALVILIFASLALGEFSWSGLVLTFFNAGVVALASNGGYDAVKGIVEHNETQIQVREEQMKILEANKPVE